jgi:carbon monoxide dehydrogenase subunit G
VKLSGSFEVPGNREQVYSFLTDPEKVVASLPDVQSSEVQADGFTVEARVGVGPMRGTMKVHLDIVEREPNQRAVYQGQGKGLGSTVDLTAAFDLREAASGTAVDWSGDARIGGRLTSVAGGMLEPLAKKNLERFVGSVRQSLESEARA